MSFLRRLSIPPVRALALPRGQSLPDAAWRRRHRGVVTLLWLHVPGFALYSAIAGHGVLHSVAHAAPVALFALLATHLRSRRKLAAAVASVGLLTASALLVHASGGVIEAHFHFFVMIAVVTLYEDWIPFLLAFAYVVLHHGIVGVLDSTGVYNHADAQAHPWRWAAIHGVFVAAAGAANVVTWRLNEDVRAERTRRSERRAQESEERFRTIFESAPIGIAICDLDGRVIDTNAARQRMLGMSADELRGTEFWRYTHPDSRDEVAEAYRHVLERGDDSVQLEKLDVGASGNPQWVDLTLSVARDAEGRPDFVIAMAADAAERRRTADERDRLLTREQEQVRRLRELDRLKDDFVASVSHELRTPLTSIRGYLELVLGGEAGDVTDDQRRFLAIVDRNADRLARLVGDLLFASQIDAQQLTLARDPVAVSEIVAESVETAQPRANMKDVELAASVAADVVVCGDRSRLTQVLDNLVSNAIKFTPAGGRVDVRARAENGVAVVEVADTGFGIPHDEQDRLFERFFRTSTASELAIDGTGLGLAIAKAIVEAHGGRITFASADGAGTTFRLEIPLQAGRPRVAGEPVTTTA